MLDISNQMTQAQEERTRLTKESELLRKKFDEVMAETDEQVEFLGKQVRIVEEKTGSDFLNGQAKKLIGKATEE